MWSNYKNSNNIFMASSLMNSIAKVHDEENGT